MQSVRIVVARRSEYAGGDAFEVFGDTGRGSVDLEHPLTPRPVRLWPDAPPGVGFLQDGHLLGLHLEGLAPDGHLEGVHLVDAHLLPELAVVWESRPYEFGRFTHILKMVDAVGNRSSDPSPAFVQTINSAPRAPQRFEKFGYDPQADQVIFRST